MKTFLKSILPRVQEHSKWLDSKAELTQEPWIHITDTMDVKEQYIFRDNGGLIHSVNGRVDKGNWELLGNTLLMDITTGSYLFNKLMVDDNLMMLQLDNTDEVALFVKANKFHSSMKMLADVTKYLEQNETGGYSIPYDSRTDFFYLEGLKEHGPFTKNELENKYYHEDLNAMVFVRTEFESDYSERRRLKDIVD